ncbi:MAG: tRNA (adenosine(37)-N6)-dimethylallyltransferase MiaA [Bacilli bacterium]|nr:tRNA (adenosine(37)-N6)-dimethylallyltransferase MiaA [Bacilli bacterium]
MIIVIAGATGSGKSHLAVELAKRIGGEVINADAFQVYKELSIATAKPSKEMREAVPHHLFDFVPLDEEYNVYRYQQDLRRTLNEVISRGKTPIIAGGTGLYIRAGLFDYEFGETEKPDMSKYEAMSDEELYQALKDIDEESAASIHPHNRVRVKRAIEIYLSSGKKKSEIIKEQKHEPIYPVKFFGLKPERDELYQKVESRVDEMFEMGLVEEGVALIKKY